MLENHSKKSHFQSWGNSQNFLTLVVLIGAIGSYLWLAFSAEINLLTPAGLKAVIEDNSVLSALVYMGILALSVIVSPIPGAPLVIAGGAIWEFPISGIYSILGGFTGGMVAYLVGRTLGHSTIQTLTNRSLDLPEQYKNKYAGWLIFFSRLFPILPFGFISYASGIARLSPKSYVVGTLLGMTPPTLLLSYLGESLTTSMTSTILVLILILILFAGLPLGMRLGNVSLPEVGSTREFFNQFTVNREKINEKQPNFFK